MRIRYISMLNKLLWTMTNKETKCFFWISKIDSTPVVIWRFSKQDMIPFTP